MHNTIKGSPWDLGGTQTQELPVEKQVQSILIDDTPRSQTTGDETSEVRDFKAYQKDLESMVILRVAQAAMLQETVHNKDHTIPHPARE